MRVAYLAAEVAPLAKVGGLGDVAGSLPPALARAGANVVVVMPRYGSIDLERVEAELLTADVVAQVSGRQERFSLYRAWLDDVPILLLDHPDLFGAPEVYIEHRDRERFTSFCHALPATLAAAGIAVDVIHANDWHMALAVAQPGVVAARVFTIHNLAHQGITAVDHAQAFGIDTSRLLPVERASSPPLVNLLARAASAADVVTTVSPSYAREITTPEFGAGLDRVLLERGDDLVGILNGIDVSRYDPAIDPALHARYSIEDMAGKRSNKVALQRELGLSVDLDVPLIGCVSRLDHQKGIDLLAGALEPVLATGVQVAVLGSGLPQFHDWLSALNGRFRGRFSARLAFDVQLAQRIYAGADMFLMPSRYEPCGLGQMIAMRYGTVPIVRQTGGLADTVSENGSLPNGFTFADYTTEGLVGAVQRAVFAFRQPESWHAIVASDMRADVSWERAAGAYIGVYRRAIAKVGVG
jgi:starch synthase